VNDSPQRYPAVRGDNGKIELKLSRRDHLWHSRGGLEEARREDGNLVMADRWRRFTSAFRQTREPQFKKTSTAARD